uniref:UBN2 domain-containing protein n=1 Tax=Gossypium raimondii TaxID=29730 RepID=A0A0D2V4S6_GOSRA|nr:hypothetical protein B456_012G106600 [Gossypium raimondii]
MGSYNGNTLDGIYLSLEFKAIRKVLRSLPKRFSTKATAIEEAKDINAMCIDELVESLQTFEINLDETKRSKIKREKNIFYK